MVLGGLKKKVARAREKRQAARELDEEMQKIEDEAYADTLKVESAKKAKARGVAKAQKRATRGSRVSSIQETLNKVAVGFKKVQIKAAELERSGFGRVDLFQTGGFGTADLLGMGDLNKKKKKKKTTRKKRTRL